MPVISLCYRFAAEGIENPRVMKSDCLAAMPLLEENSPFRFSFGAIFRRLLRSACSTRTLAVSAAVSSCLMASDDVSIAVLFGGRLSPAVSSILSASASASLLGPACFRFLLEPVAFFKECVRPSDCSFDNRSRRRSLSVDDTGRIGIILFEE